jgi:hypothetical protein
MGIPVGMLAWTENFTGQEPPAPGRQRLTDRRYAAAERGAGAKRWWRGEGKSGFGMPIHLLQTALRIRSRCMRAV